MADYIKREDAIMAAIAAVDEWDEGYITSRDDMIECYLNDIPAADVRENVGGKWEYHDYGLDANGKVYFEIECSACHVKLPMIREVDFDFCPWCGADMRGKNYV